MDTNYFINRYAILATCSIIIIVGVHGNALVIYVFGWRKRKSRSTYEVLLLLLAITDLFCCIALPAMIIRRYSTPKTPEGTAAEVRCWVLELFTSYGISVAHTLILLICFERYRKITSPFNTGLQRKEVIIGMCAGAFVGIAITVPFFVSGRIICQAISSRGHVKLSLSKFTTELVVYLALSLIRDVIAVILMAILVHKMLVSLSKTSSSSLPDPDGSRKRKFTSARRMLIVMIVWFTLCVLPRSVYYLAIVAMIHSKYNFGSYRTTIKLMAITAYFEVLLAASCMVNPIVYSFMHPELVKLRKDFVSFLMEKVRTKKSEKVTDGTGLQQYAGKDYMTVGKQE